MTTKANRNNEKANLKKFLRCFTPSEIVSHDKKGWYCSELTEYGQFQDDIEYDRELDVPKWQQIKL